MVLFVCVCVCMAKCYREVFWGSLKTFFLFLIFLYIYRGTRLVDK
jgi:hypothetical protein